jgi:hypothetical protein
MSSIDRTKEIIRRYKNFARVFFSFSVFFSYASHPTDDDFYRKKM